MFLAAAGAAAALCVTAARPALAQDYPAHAIQFVVTSTPGTTADQLARVLGVRLSQRLGVPVVVDNKVGAGGAVGIEAVARAPADGYTVLFSATSFSTLPALRSRLAYDPAGSFASVLLLGTTPLVLAVPGTLPVQSVAEFIGYAKKQPPGRLNYASPGVGSIQHLVMELFKQQTGLHLTHIPYKGTAGALNDLAAGHVEAGIVTLQTAIPLAQSGKIRILAVTGAQRMPQFPQAPPLAQLGFPQLVAEAWFGVAVPAGTPAAVVSKLNSELNGLLAVPEVREALARAGVEPAGGAPDRLDALVRSETRMWKQLVKSAHIAAE